MAKKEFNSFEEEFAHDYRRHKKYAKASAIVKLIGLGVFLLWVIVMLVIIL